MFLSFVSKRNAYFCLALAAVCAIAHPGVGHAQATKRPLYVIAHRINDSDMIADALKSGANGIEIDVRYDKAGKEWIVDHDRIAAGSTKLSDWLNAAVKAEKTYGKQWALLFLDVKTPENLANLHTTLRNKLPANLNLIFSVNDFASRDALFDVISKIDAYAGYTIDDSNGKPTAREVSDFYKKNKIHNGWYGTGITVALPDLGVKPAIRRGVALRDRAPEIKKVYAWTLEKESSVETYFRDLRVDGVFVNLKWGTTGANRIPMGVAVAKKLGVLATRDTPAFQTYVDPYVYVRLCHEGGYFAKFLVQWKLDGKIQEFRSGKEVVTWTTEVKIPREAKDIKVRAEAFLISLSWADIYNGPVSPGCYTVSGTSYRSKIAWAKDY